MAKDKKIDKFDMLEGIDDVIGAADMTSSNNSGDTVSPKKKKVRKEISLDVDLIETLKKHHTGTLASYIVIAVQEKMKRDGMI